MNEMYEYLEEHAYISKNKKSNYQFELTQERAECIANKHNSLCEEKDEKIEELNNKLLLIKGIIRTPRELDKSLAYAMVKIQIETVLGSDKE